MEHKTKDCFTLKDAIEEVVRNDELKEFVAQDDSSSGQSFWGTDKGKIEDEEWKTSNTKRKTHLRSVMLVNSLKRLRWQEKWKVEFNEEDEDSICDEEGNDPMVVSTTIARFEVKIILIDSGSVMEVLTLDAYQKTGLKEHALKKASPLYGFANHPVEVKVCITLPVILEDSKHTTTKYVQFFVVDHEIACNAIFRLDVRSEERICKPEITELNVFPMAKSVKKKRRRFAPQIVEAIRQKVGKLLSARFIKEVAYPDRVSNVVMMKKTNEKWRMSIDFTNLNKACPTDGFPFPSIDRLVDALSCYSQIYIA
ncbi:RNA-directed DNA polymerase-like protein [Gossypium australe]|uniref:RNA-directed DNA polymerase-like protein n=1 Tax=Gossypium australe TaxID=47621 RepID=A0A5B6WSU1_9ROSI|nr:RNA-directed DNA polymerase-like protein [Gossypium australe]